MSSPSHRPIKPPLSRWLLAIGIDALLLALLWWEHLYPRRAAFELGGLLVLMVAVNSWEQLLRRFWLARKVRRVFGSSIEHLRPLPLSLAYRCVSGLGDLLVTASLIATGLPWLAWAYGLAALLVQAGQWKLARAR